MRNKEQEILNALVATEPKNETVNETVKPYKRRTRGLFAIGMFPESGRRRLGAMPFTIKFPS